MNEKEKILVVDDDESIRENIIDILEYEEYEVFSAVNGLKGIELAKKVHPDLILCDVNMPEMDGYGFLEEIQKDPDLKTRPFVFLTARGEKEEIRKGMDSGADDYLSKPFKAAELISAVETRLEQNRVREDINRQKWDQFSEEISTMIPHELKTPLNSLCSLTEVLRDDWENMETSEIQEYLDLMSESGKRLNRVAGNLSLYSHLRSLRDAEVQEEPLRTEPEEIDLFVSPISENVASEYQRLDDLLFDFEEPAPTSGNSTLLGKAFEELLDNAFKFSTKGTPVKVSIRSDEKGPTITIEDSGPGMEPQQIEEIGALVQFNRRKKEQQGVGLGLALAREICDHLGCNLEILNLANQSGLKTTIILSPES